MLTAVVARKREKDINEAGDMYNLNNWPQFQGDWLAKYIQTCYAD